MDESLAAILDSLAKIPPIGEWVRDAACRGQGDTFTTYPQAKAALELVEQTCRRCPVRGACLMYALEHGQDVAGAVWAGEWFGPDGAVTERPQRESAVVCGTLAGYRRHRRIGEPSCQPCRDANAAVSRERSASKRSAA